MEQTAKFDVSTKDRTVRIDLAGAEKMRAADVDAIVGTVDELLADPDVDAVRLGGRAFLQGIPPDGITDVVRALGALAKQHDKEFIVGPI